MYKVQADQHDDNNKVQQKINGTNILVSEIGTPSAKIFAYYDVTYYAWNIYIKIAT